MLKIVPSNQFRKDLKLAAKRGLTGEYCGFRECHIEPDWLLVYRTNEEELELFLFRTGSHADLF